MVHASLNHKEEVKMKKRRKVKTRRINKDLADLLKMPSDKVIRDEDDG